MNTVKRFVCYYAGINLVLAALLLGVAWVAPDDDGSAVPVAHVQSVATPSALTPDTLAIATPVSAPAPLLASAEMPAN